MEFIHKISKGTRFNQIYIPKENEKYFEVGDVVKVKLIEKKINLYYSKNLKKLSKFKENIVKEIFSLLSNIKEIKQIFIFGSFLTNKIDYKDIDILIISEKANENKAYNLLSEKLDLKFHVISMSQSKLEALIKICPLTKSMMYYYISNKNLKLSEEYITDKHHIEFLLMMPEDLLELNLNGKIYYDNLRRLISIERFLNNKELNPLKINEEVKELIGKDVFLEIYDNEKVSESEMKKLKEIIKNKINKIKELIK